MQLEKSGESGFSPQEQRTVQHMANTSKQEDILRRKEESRYINARITLGEIIRRRKGYRGL